MDARPVRFAAAAAVLATFLLALSPAAAQPASQPSSAPADFDSIVARLGHDDFREREDATRDLLALGPGAAGALRARLTEATDPEIRLRLDYILDNIVPPEQAALVVRAREESGLIPGDVITHVANRRVRSVSEVRLRLRDAGTGAMVRVLGERGPRDVGPVTPGEIVELSDFHAPQGTQLSRALRAYATGQAEQAYELLSAIREPISDHEMTPLLRARIAFTAGDATAARRVLETVDPRMALAFDSDNQWSGASQLELAGPGRPPLHLELWLLNRGGANTYQTSGDPDLRVQRVFVSARRFQDAFLRSSELWWTRYRGSLGADRDSNRIGGNMLAVCAWMLSEMDLVSECSRLIGPRSAILETSWLRVQTEAWLPFLSGDPRQAIDGFYEDASRVLHTPPPANDPAALYRVPQVAAMLAFFLYQAPDDPRLEEMLQAMNVSGHPVIVDYVHWMLCSLNESNAAKVRAHLQALLPNVGDAQAGAIARCVALFEYVQQRPDRDVIQAARQRIAQSPDLPERERWLAVIDALAALAANRLDDAARALEPFVDEPEMAVLRHTIAFRSAPPATVAGHAVLAEPGGPRLAVPFGSDGQRWLVLTSDRRLQAFDASAGLLAPVETASATWYPSPLTWPWLGREERSGRVWTYDRRRVWEIAQPGLAPLRLNIETSAIRSFARWVPPAFETVAQAVAEWPQNPGENSEFLRSEIRANGEYVSDPDLPELGLIQPVPGDARVIHLAFRGGPHLVVDAQSGRAWTSVWIGRQLQLDHPPTFFAVAEVNATTPRLVLLSDQGLIRFDLRDESIRRLALPADPPYPALIPEETPYERRDPDYAYCARLPQDGGQVYRLVVAAGQVEKVDMVNEMLPAAYFAVQSRSALRASLDAELVGLKLPPLQEFIRDTEQVVDTWQQEAQP